MEVQIECKVQKKDNSVNWKDNVATPIPGYYDLDLQTMDGKIKLKQLPEQKANDYLVGKKYQVTFNLASFTDKYGNLFYKPQEILDAKPK